MANWNVQAGPFSIGSGGNGGDASGVSTGGTGTLLGTNQLQTSIDKFTTSVDKLDSIVGRLSGLGGSSSSNGGGQNLTSTQRNLPSSPYMQTPPGASTLPMTAPYGRTANGGGPNIPQSQRQTNAPNGGTNGGGGSGGWAGGPVSGGLSKMGFGGGGAVAGAGMLADSFVQYGKNQLPTQVAMSGFAQTAALAMNGGNPTANANAVRYAAFGGGNQNLNALASSPQDAIAGQQGINFVAGQGAVGPGTTSSYGRGALGATAMFGLSNQGMSYAQSSQMMQQMYAPSTSMKFMQYGFPVTPRMQGGGLRNSAQVAQGMIQGFYGSNKVSPQELAFSLRQGGNAQTTLQSMFGNQSGDYANMLQAENQVAWKSGDNATQINTLFNQAARGTPSSMKAAQAQLQKYGVNTSDFQSIKDLQSVKTGRTSDVANSFNAGLQTATGLLTSFNAILTKIVDLPGINQVVGGAGGLGGGLSSLTNPGNMLLGMGGGSLLLKRVLAGRAAASAAGASGDAALIAGDGGAVAGGAAASGLGVLGPVGGSVLAAMAISHLGGGANSPRKGVNQDWTSFGKEWKNWLWNDPQQWMKDASNALPSITSPMSWFGGGGNNQPNRPGGAAAPAAKSVSASTKNMSSAGGVSGAAKSAVGSAEQELGKPYVWGGDSPKVGFDCSGLVEWAYGTAGIHLPRTSQEQWAALSQKNSVPTNKTIEGDIVFQAGSDGTLQAPGHEAMMISSSQIIEAPYTGMNIRIRAYNPKEWQHAARPSGGGGSAATTSASATPAAPSLTGNSNSGGGNSGLGMSTGSYGSSEELDTVTSSLLGGGGGVNTGFAAAAATTTPAGGAKGAGSTATGAPANTAGITGGGSISANRALMQKLASAYGWGSGAEWSALDWLNMAESGYNNKIWNTTGSGAYGIAQALPASKYPLAGRPPSEGGSSDPKSQELWELGYIKGRYGDPVKAKAFHLANNFYAAGTSSALPGWAWTGERGPELKNMAGGEQILSATASAHVAAQAAKGPAEPASLISGNNGASSGCSGHPINVSLTFPAGAIQINGNLSSASTVSGAANEIISQVQKGLASQQIYAQIAAGAHGG